MKDKWEVGVIERFEDARDIELGEIIYSLALLSLRWLFAWEQHILWIIFADNPIFCEDCGHGLPWEGLLGPGGTTFGC